MLRHGLPDLRIGPVDASAAEQLVTAAARASPAPASLSLSLALLNGEAADAAAYAARALLLVPDDDSAGPFSRKHTALVLDDAPLSAAASRDLAATLHEGVSRFKARAMRTQLTATVTEAAAAGPVSAAFALAYALGGPSAYITHLDLKIQGPWSEAGAAAWAHALEVVREDGPPSAYCDSSLRLEWLHAAADGDCPLCSSCAGVSLLAAAARLAAECTACGQPMAVQLLCASCPACQLRHPPVRGSGGDDEGTDEDEEEEEEDEEDEEAEEEEEDVHEDADAA